MKRSTVVVPWRGGLHLRPAARLVKLTQKFRSSIILRSGAEIADLGSVLSVLALAAVAGANLEVEASGTDEIEALRAVEAEFSSGSDTSRSAVVA
jgi:phosphotransferase system HPr (HPr) family protein